MARQGSRTLTVSGLVFTPSVCACCGGVADSTLTISKEHHVGHDIHIASYVVPACEKCEAHAKSAEVPQRIWWLVVVLFIICLQPLRVIENDWVLTGYFLVVMAGFVWWSADIVKQRRVDARSGISSKCTDSVFAELLNTDRKRLAILFSNRQFAEIFARCAREQGLLLSDSDGAPAPFKPPIY